MPRCANGTRKNKKNNNKCEKYNKPTNKKTTEKKTEKKTENKTRKYKKYMKISEIKVSLGFLSEASLEFIPEKDRDYYVIEDIHFNSPSNKNVVFDFTSNVIYLQENNRALDDDISMDGNLKAFLEKYNFDLMPNKINKSHIKIYDNYVDDDSDMTIEDLKEHGKLFKGIRDFQDDEKHKNMIYDNVSEILSKMLKH